MARHVSPNINEFASALDMAPDVDLVVLTSLTPPSTSRAGSPSDSLDIERSPTLALDSPPTTQIFDFGKDSDFRASSELMDTLGGGNHWLFLGIIQRVPRSLSF